MAVFADTHYWVAVANSADQWSAAAVTAQSRLERLDIVTTDEVLVEFLQAERQPELKR